VSSTRLSQHIDKGNEDGLYISSVASSQGLWALIMDAGTGFTSQVYELSPQFFHKVNFNLLWIIKILCLAHQICMLLKIVNLYSFKAYLLLTSDFLFLFKEWIMEQWEKGYYINAVAGVANGSSLVVMSKGWFLLSYIICVFYEFLL
jgi:hypothetical protein